MLAGVAISSVPPLPTTSSNTSAFFGEDSSDTSSASCLSSSSTFGENTSNTSSASYLSSSPSFASATPHWLAMSTQSAVCCTPCPW